MQITKRLRTVSLRPLLSRHFIQNYRLLSYKGSCHCGVLSYEYKTGIEFKNWSIRECQCSFCRKHNASNVSDKNGEINLICDDDQYLNRYQFADKVCQFWLCNNCGVYIGAVSNDEKCASINITTLDQKKEILDIQQKNEQNISTKMNYNDETPQQKIQRRSHIWTPIHKIKIGNRTIVNAQNKYL